MSASKRSKRSEPKEMVRYPEYNDHMERDDAWVDQQRRVRGVEDSEKTTGATKKFPVQLHAMLTTVDATTHAAIVSWLPHGRAFKVYDKKQFVEQVLPHHFRFQTDYASFQRQLNLYGILRLTRQGPDRKAYYHELLLRNRTKMATLIPRQTVGAHSVRRKYDTSTEPDFHAMTAIPGPAAASYPMPTSEAFATEDVAPARPVAPFPAGRKTRGLSASDYIELEHALRNQPHIAMGMSEQATLAANPGVVGSSDPSTAHAARTGRSTSRKKRSANRSQRDQANISEGQQANLRTDQTASPTEERRAGPTSAPTEQQSAVDPAPRKRRRGSSSAGTDAATLASVLGHDVDQSAGQANGANGAEPGTSSDSESPSKLARWADFFESVDLDTSSDSNG